MHNQKTEPITMNVPGYEPLAAILSRAYDQAARGKGKERHADAKPFALQPMQTIAQRRGLGFILGQADKKSEEAQGMLERGEVDKCVHELLGAIVYLAGAILNIEAHRPAPAQAAYPGGWIPNRDGKMPAQVQGHTHVLVTLRDGAECGGLAESIRWAIRNTLDDVLAWKLAPSNDNEAPAPCQDKGGCAAPKQCGFNGRCLGAPENG